DVLRDVLVRDHRIDALHRLRLARVELRDRCVVLRRAKRLHPERLADADVVDELCAARDVTEAVVPGETCADGLHAGLPLGSTSGSPSPADGRSGTASTSPRDAAMTASTIFT